MFCPNCGNSIENESKFCSYCGIPIGNNNIMYNVNPPVQLPMKWYKFLIYVLLFLGALVNISSLGSVIENKWNYDENKERISEVVNSGNSYYNELFDMFKSMDVFFNVSVVLAVFTALMAIMAIVVRQKLAHYKKEGPKLFLIYYGLILALNLAAALTAYICLPKEILENMNYNLSQIYVYIIIDILMIVCNRIYFKKREYLFIN